MEEDFLKRSYIDWRLTGSITSEINQLIALHFYFRKEKKEQIYKFFKTDFKEELGNEKDEISLKSEIEFFESSFSDDLPDFGSYDEDTFQRVSDEQNQENDLVLGLVQQAEWAFIELYETEYRKIKSFVTKNSGATEDAQDVFQDGIVVLLEKIKTPGFEFSCKVGTYLYSCCRNIWLKQLRKSSKEISNDYYEIYDTVDVSLLEEPENHEEKLAAILSTVSESCLKLFKAFYYECKSWDVIANELGYNTTNSAKNQKYKCLKKISAS